ncbi:MAG TPA: hypothetical protein DDW76_05420 [Cyanobacteria bacterium UBA11369]|nr:hypothetical protein [Cyanobacteria bacterium UBA11371]HBE34492.1 hypothetical protein [Cyanobacteria bacterium UBA11368]HBE48246.1 hypothetical protein [Cyanobacteria bacterium UBA11369]
MTTSSPTPTPNNWWSKFIQTIQKFPPLVISLGLVGGIIKTAESVNNIVQLPESVCRANPSFLLCPPEKLDPEWIGTRIEDVYIKKLQNYEPETTLVVTDKPEKTTENEDISILRNVDQDNSRINLGTKKNSGQYEAFLRRAKSERKPVCLRVYGRRNFETSEFKNIIDYNEFPSDQVYKNLTPQRRDQIFKSLTPQQRDQLYKGLKPQERDQLYKGLKPQERDQACKEFNPSPRWQGDIKRFLWFL